MNPPRCNALGYSTCLLATPDVASATEAARVQPTKANAPARDAFTRLLHRLEPDPETLWQEARPPIRLAAGALVLDDTVLDKPHARHIDLGGRHWSGKHKRVVRGIDLVSLAWTAGDRIIPCDYRVYHDAKAATKNDHFRATVDVAHTRGFKPHLVLCDGWYASLENRKHLRSLGWGWLTRLKANRLVNTDRQGPRPLSRTDMAATGTEVWLTGYGLVKVFTIVAPDGDIACWASDDLRMTGLQRQQMAEYGWAIETCHRGIKQHTEVEGGQARSARAQRTHIGLALRTLLRLEWHLFSTGISWAEAKAAIIRDAVRAYLAHPTINLPTA